MIGLRSNRLLQRARLVRAAGAVTVLSTALISSAGVLEAQTSSYHSATDNVTINWGAIDGAPAPQSTPMYAQQPVARGGLLVPGPSTPRSTLHVPAPNGSKVTLRQPSAAPSAPTPAPSMPKAPSPAPAPQVAEAPTPPAKIAPPPAAPAPMPKAPAAPPPPTEQASAAPPPPPPPVSEPPAPAAAAPPPPAMPAAETPKAPAAPAPTEQASTPPAPATTGDGPAQVLFNNDDTKLTADGQAVLAGVIEKLNADENQRVQLMAFAAGEDLTSSKARRISLSRALSVRSFLIEKGIRSTRIDVRALGDKAENDPKNRVDVNLVTR